jgi:diguanylate cyclase (GGDEF)-like protein
MMKQVANKPIHLEESEGAASMWIRQRSAVTSPWPERVDLPDQERSPISGVFEQKDRILIVDDNASIHEDFRKILVDQSDRSQLTSLKTALFGDAAPAPTQTVTYHLDSAFQGQEGWQCVRNAVEHGRPYAVAFVDMRMPPGWDGLETIANIWKEDPDIQIVICTAYSDYTWAEIASRLGRTDRLLLLKKPFDNAEVCLLAYTLTEKWHLARQAQGRLQELERMVQARTIDLQRANEHLKREITWRKEAEDRLRYDALHDSLTGLPNRTLLMNRLAHCVQRAHRRKGCSCATLFLDIDNFKVVNDGLGHTAGDKLLVKVAERLAASLRATDSVARYSENLTARLGGDEFVIVLEDITRPDDAVWVAERLLEQLARPYDINGHEIVITASIGITLVNGAEKTAEELLRDADTALYQAKAAGKAQFVFFDETMHAAAMSRLQLENDLRRAIDQREFVIEYQPIVALNSLAVRGCEALIRWVHPSRGVILPCGFIPIAEETGLIVPLGRWILQEALCQIKTWNDRLPPQRALVMSVNISRRQLIEPGFVAEVDALLQRMGVDRKHLQFEITESAIMESPALITAKLRGLQALNVRLHMDDFGTGQSSIGCLQAFPFDVLKIDRSFVQRLDRDKKYTAIVQAVIALGHNLDMKIVAEGVETGAQLTQLVALGCDYGQGFLFSRSMNADEFWALLETSVSLTPRNHTGDEAACDPSDDPDASAQQ